MKRVLLFVLITTCLSYCGLYWFFHASIDRVLTQNQQIWLLTEIRNCSPLPSNVYLTLEKYFPGFYDENSWSYKMKSVLGLSATDCQCTEIYLPFVPGYTREDHFKPKWIPFEQHDLVVKLFIEQHFSQKQCLTYHLQIEGIGNARGIVQASKYYFKKQVDSLSEREVIGLYLLSKSSRFDLLKYPESFDNAVMNLKEKGQLNQ